MSQFQNYGRFLGGTLWPISGFIDTRHLYSYPYSSTLNNRLHTALSFSWAFGEPPHNYLFVYDIGNIVVRSTVSAWLHVLLFQGSDQLFGFSLFFDIFREQCCYAILRYYKVLTFPEICMDVYKNFYARSKRSHTSYYTFHFFRYLKIHSVHLCKYIDLEGFLSL